MATIYRFIVEQKAKAEQEGRKSSLEKVSKSPAKSKKTSSLFGSSRGGVEHNRKLRAINPLLNRMTGGYWEKGMRGGRAGIGLLKAYDKEGMKGVVGAVGFTILLALIITTLLKIQAKERAEANRKNTQDFKMLENGSGAIHGAYEVSSSWWNGRLTYNQNK